MEQGAERPERKQVDEVTGYDQLEQEHDDVRNDDGPGYGR
jgi:hypothetical protein